MEIFASKIYRGLSKDRQSHIRAAINDPINVELVTQLKSYLDEEYQVVADPDEAAEVVVDEVGAESGTSTTDDGSPSESAPSGGGGKSFGDKVNDIENELGEMPGGDQLEDLPEELPEESADEVNESVNINKIPITASITDAVQEIKGMLNLVDTTAGVARVIVKDRELWIYYQDNINLNNVMYDVMDRINASGYTYLNFNRLARSDNAIVFDVTYVDTEDVVKPNHEEE